MTDKELARYITSQSKEVEKLVENANRAISRTNEAAANARTITIDMSVVAAAADNAAKISQDGKRCLEAANAAIKAVNAVQQV